MFFENLEFCEYLGPKPFDTLDYSPLSEPDGEILYLNLIEAVRVMAVTARTYRYGKNITAPAKAESSKIHLTYKRYRSCETNFYNSPV